MLNRTPERLNALLQSLSNLGSDRLIPLASSDPGALSSLGLTVYVSMPLRLHVC